MMVDTDYFPEPAWALAKQDDVELLITVAEANGHDHPLYVPLIHKAIGVLAAKQQNTPLNAEEEYTWAYALYCLNEPKRHHEQIAYHLQAALRLNPEHTFAQLYLGHLYFDMGQFESAYGVFTAIESGVLNGQHHQLWREVKRLELILSCAIHLKKHDAIALYLTQLFDLLEEHLVSDGYLASPIELIAALQTQVSQAVKAKVKKG